MKRSRIWWLLSGHGVLMAALFGIASLGDDCDDDKKKEAPAASSQAPTPEKIAGVEDGVVKVCAVPKVPADEAPLTLSLAERDDKPAQHTLKKTDKGLCDWVTTGDLTRLGWNGLVFKSDYNFSEVGIYYLEKFKENPTDKDLSYAKAAPMPDGSFRLNLRILSEVPGAEMHVR